ncbi:hypothetical protein SRHO_G00000300 [Serrasalmus rhombeus]
MFSATVLGCLSTAASAAYRPLASLTKAPRRDNIAVFQYHFCFISLSGLNKEAKQQLIQMLSAIYPLLTLCQCPAIGVYQPSQLYSSVALVEAFQTALGTHKELDLMGFQAEILSRDIRKVIREGSVQLQSREQNFKAERFEQLERKV